MVAHQKKTLFERKGLQNPPIDKKKLPNRRKTKENIKINAKIFARVRKNTYLCNIKRKTGY